jgi:hypothetical protein
VINPAHTTSRGPGRIISGALLFPVEQAPLGAARPDKPAILCSLAFAAWVPVVRGLSQAPTELARPYGSVGLD